MIKAFSGHVKMYILTGENGIEEYKAPTGKETVKGGYANEKTTGIAAEYCYADVFRCMCQCRGKGRSSDDGYHNQHRRYGTA